jgi:hypothetical protein
VPSERSYQVLIRGLPCAPPPTAPMAAIRPFAQATEYSTLRGP